MKHYVEWRLRPEHWRARTLDSDKRWTVFRRCPTAEEAERVRRTIPSKNNDPHQDFKTMEFRVTSKP